MKIPYQQPLLTAICIVQTQLICDSGSTIPPGGPNQPAGAPRRNRRKSAWDYEDDFEEDYCLPSYPSPMAEEGI